MKLIFFIIAFLSLILISFQIIELKEYYNGQGVIFDSSVKYPFVEPNYNKAHTPNLSEIKRAEKILSEKYYEYRTNVLDSFNVDKSIIKKRLKKPKNVIKKFHKYNRQYISYVSKSNDTIISIGLLNFANKRKAEKNFTDWKKTIQFGFHGFYEDNQEWVSINITDNEFIYKIGK
ncbi:hypothetical protein DFR65_106113 [Oceanihabitans sediminis]|uniref:Uncharacterized protein n=1 Tax=Oceanihabitans sediminis TaxID=1812012 RepID=A0A368P4H4_9FLAO|nr:hypothetical protein [Oceanihabitans sediminis]RBP29092.1 hypothetical protein DFR65_106113 [Oceanihabitans sediminis]RCU56984.1 hypothetical protein DU428_08525 [Oceanihabitans sediminis]